MEIRKYCEILEIEEQMKWFKPLTREEFFEMVTEEETCRTKNEPKPSYRN